MFGLVIGGAPGSWLVDRLGLDRRAVQGSKHVLPVENAENAESKIAGSPLDFNLFLSPTFNY